MEKNVILSMAIVIGLFATGMFLLQKGLDEGTDIEYLQNNTTTPTVETPESGVKTITCDLIGNRDVVFLKDGTEIALEIMRTNEEHKRGLMGREGIGENEGMLFFSKRDYAAGQNLFWMKHMKFPIDMIWLDKNFKIVYIERDVPPCNTKDCPLYGPQVVSRHVLELKANSSAKHGMVIGDTLRPFFCTI